MNKVPENQTIWLATMVILAGALHAAPATAGLVQLERVAEGLTNPVYATHAPGDDSRLFIVERGTPVGQQFSTASIKILNLDTGQVEATPFLSIPNVDNRSEGGLLGMAFHPDYQNNGKFYVNLTAHDDVPDTVFSTYIREYTVSGNPNIANSSFRQILDFIQPQSNHNGGWIDFSPQDGYLYVATGDGGMSNDTGTGHHEPGGNGQYMETMLGKMLRIDVDGDAFPSDDTMNYRIPASNPFVGEDGLDEIWAYGLRNPFRASFDRATADLWIGDVGQGRREEVDFQDASSPGGENYGWRLREGLVATETGGVGGPKPPGNVDPVYDYLHASQPGDPNFEGNAVTGGYVYRGPDPSLQGVYFFADSVHSRIWMFDPADPFGTVERIDLTLAPDEGNADNPVAFGEDANGNLYLIPHYSGDIFRFKTDEVEVGDFDENAMVDGEDLLVWQRYVGTTQGAVNTMGDADGDGDVDATDLQLFEDNFGYSALDVAATPVSGTVPEPGACLLGLIALAAFNKLRR